MIKADGKVVVFTTGGTIAMRFDPEKGGAVPAVTGEELISAVPPLKEVADIEVREFSNFPSGHMTMELMKELGDMIEGALQEKDVLGAVVTHGTDTVEETAYFLDLYVKSAKPICLTAAMRSAAEISPDGPKNILNAVQVAASKGSVGKGAMVVLNEQIHAAREVTKTHTGNVATFASPFWGPIGYADADKIVFARDNIDKQKIHPSKVVSDIHIIKVHTNIDDFLINCLIEKGVKGIIIEAYGRGNVTPKLFKGIQRAVEANIPVVITTRCLGGRVVGVYAYEGGVHNVLKLGAISGGELNGQKARIKLGLALGEGSDLNKIKRYFDNP